MRADALTSYTLCQSEDALRYDTVNISDRRITYQMLIVTSVI
jgi:hypothetical protein